MKLVALIGSGTKIGLLTLPFLVAGIALNVMFPSWFAVGGPSHLLALMSIVVLVPGLVIWVWCVVLIVTRVPRGELITHGPYAIVKHPLYTNVSLLVLPWIGFLLDTWLGIAIAVVEYVGTRIFSHEEEEVLAGTFGSAWDAYYNNVKIPWL